jgi:uracil-DNA glycosylase
MVQRDRVSCHHPGVLDPRSDWNEKLREHFRAPWFAELQAFVADERRRHRVFPAADDVFAALSSTSLGGTRVVLLGQDPYHGPGQAMGLAFSVARGVPVPPSLRNVFIERRDDLGLEPPTHGDLSAWASRGVLLLNTTLTVRAGAPGSHRGRGWERLTEEVIRAVAAASDHVVFLLWGADARRRRAVITEADPHTRHSVIESAHPSPLSARTGFFGSRPFSRTNDALVAHGDDPIDWSLPT